MSDALKAALEKAGIRPADMLPLGQVPALPVREMPDYTMPKIGQHLLDAYKYAQTGYVKVEPNKPLRDHSDAELIMEMIRRGYAAMKLPSDGGPPEVLR